MGSVKEVSKVNATIEVYTESVERELKAMGIFVMPASLKGSYESGATAAQTANAYYDFLVESCDIGYNV